MSLSGVQPSRGVVPERWEATVKVRGGNVSAGRVYAFTLLQSASITSDGETISAEPGAPGYLYGSIAAVSSTDRRTGRFCVALESANDLEDCRVLVRGIERVYVIDSANTVSIGEELIAAASGGNLEAATVTGGSTLRKILGLAMEANSTNVSDGALMTVDFDGWSGVGSANAT